MWKDVFGREHRYGPPAGWVMPATEQFNSQDEWPKLVARGIEFPKYDGPVDLGTARGTCLNPLLAAKNTVYRSRPVAPDEPLVDGGLYVISRDRVGEDDMSDHELFKKTDKREFINFLRFACFEWWTVCNEGVGKLENLPGFNIIAMVVGVTTLSACGKRFDAMPVVSNDTSLLGANAASQILAQSFSGIFPATIFGITVPANSTTALTSVFTQTGTMTGAPVAIDLVMGLAVSLGAGATSWSAGVTVYRDGSPITGATVVTLNSANSVWAAATGNTYPIALTFVDGAPTAGSHTYAIMLTGTVAGGTANETVNATTCSFKIREIKK